MGNKSGHSWLTAVKRAFRSPTKDSQKKTSRRREESEVQEEEEEKKREKKRWLFRNKPPNNASSTCCPHQNEVKAEPATMPSAPAELAQKQSNAFAVAAATAAAAASAAATAQAAVEIIRLTRSSNPSSVKRQQYAAIIIQTSFRGYIARRALVALKGIVKLQALIRGQNVRKQAKMTLKCMQALLRVQARVRDQQARLSNDGARSSSTFAESNNLWESKYLRDIRGRKSLSKDRISCISEDYLSECPRTLEDLEAALQARKEADLKRERSLASAFSDPTWDYESGYEKELEERTKWLDKWMATKQWEQDSSCSIRGSTDHKRDSIIKTVEMDSTTPNYYYYYKQNNIYNSNSPANNPKKPQNIYYQSPHHNRPTTPNSISAASPRHRSFCNGSPAIQQPVTPSPSIKNRPLHVRSGSPRRLKEEKSYSTANTPSLRYLNHLNTTSCRNSTSTNGGTTPSYMATTESTKARVRSQSTPRSRPSTPERDRAGDGPGLGLARKRLSFPAPDPFLNGFSQNLRSPSFKSLQAGCVGLEQQSIYTDSIGGEISPCSTTDLKRWLR